MSNSKQLIALTAVLLWRWGPSPKPPAFIETWLHHEHMEWFTLFLIIGAFVVDNRFDHALIVLAGVWVLKNISDHFVETYYYNEMYKVGEPRVENRYTFI
jgi:hypothetical protein